MSAAHGNYALGRTQQEYARLARQSALIEPMTRRTFADAGIAPGMCVLDLGCGAGMDGAPDSPVFQYLADTYPSLLPKAIEFRVPTAEDVCSADELPQRIAADIRLLGYAAFVVPMVSAWCKLPPPDAVVLQEAHDNPLRQCCGPPFR